MGLDLIPSSSRFHKDTTPFVKTLLQVAFFVKFHHIFIFLCGIKQSAGSLAYLSIDQIVGMFVTWYNINELIDTRFLLYRHAIEQIFQGMMTINPINNQFIQPCNELIVIDDLVIRLQLNYTRM